MARRLMAEGVGFESVRDCTLHPLFYRVFIALAFLRPYNPAHVIGNVLGDGEKDDGSRDQPTKRAKGEAAAIDLMSVSAPSRAGVYVQDFEQRPLNSALLYQGFRRLLNKRCVITRRELTLDVQHEDAECQRLRPITSRP